jgi:DNA-binding transcriptional LysR family regulator
MAQDLPNLHHLELFYHVATHGGITAAARSMPYGIQQPAISGQISQLEETLGVRLFQRRPFRLTPEGEELYGFIAPFFHGLPHLASQLANRVSRRIRIAAPASVIRHHLPIALARVKKQVPELEITLVDAMSQDAFDLLTSEKVDLCVCELAGRAPSGVQIEKLIEVPLTLLLPENYSVPATGIHGISEELPLIRPAESSTLTKMFQKLLLKSRVVWPPTIEVTPLSLVHSYVAQGFGAGLSVRGPGMKAPTGTKHWEIPDCDPFVIIGAWRGKLTPIAAAVLQTLRAMAVAE